jgi:hypothetical protein
VCGKSGCRLYNHPDEERRKARDRYNGYRCAEGKPIASNHDYQAFLTNFEEDPTIELDSEEDDVYNKDSEEDAAAYFMVSELQERAFIYKIAEYHYGIEKEGIDHNPETNLVS